MQTSYDACAVSPPPSVVTNERLEEFHRQVMNELITSRTDYINRLDERRDYNKECGYPASPTAQQFQDLFERDPIANRIVTLLPEECFKMSPAIYETEDLGTADVKVKTAFEKSWARHVRQVASQQKSWHADDAASVIVEKWRQLDIQSGIGTFGIIFIGFKDGQKDLSQPVVPKAGMEVSYIRVFPESLVQILEKEADLSSPRYGQPTKYEITVDDPNNSTESILQVGSQTILVHWTRVIHCPSDEANTSEVYGKERMRVHLNRLIDLTKLYGGSGEMYWRGAFMGISIEGNQGITSLPVDAIRKAVLDYQNGLTRYMAMAGASVKNLSPQVVDPNKQIDAHLTAICIKMGCPKRVFMGSERGELGSSQDQAQWDDIVRGRQNSRCSPRIIIPYVDRLIWAGVLEQPGEEGWRCFWPDLDSMTARDVAEIGATKTDALNAYISSGADTAVPLKNWLIQFMGFEQEEAQQMVDAARAATKSDSLDGVIGGKLFGTVGGIYGMTELFDKLQNGAYSEDTMAVLIMLFYKVSEEVARDIIATGVEIMAPDPADELKAAVGPDGKPVKESADVGTQKPRRRQFTGRSAKLKENRGT